MLTDIEKRQLNDFLGFLSFKFTWIFKQFLKCKKKVILLIYGNQAGKTGGTAVNYVMRILGLHPVACKNVLYFECEKVVRARENEEEMPDRDKHEYSPVTLPPDMKCQCGETLKEHKRNSRTFRFCAETLPGQSANISEDGLSAEVRNTQYPEFKKWLPPFLIKKDITARNASMIIKDPYGGADIIVEFVSYNQSTQSVAGQQRLSIWCDESPSYEFYEEQLPRLLAEDGDIIFTYTPVDRSSWLFDEFFDKASVYCRSEAIVKYLNSKGDKVKKTEKTDSPYNIAVMQAATDDNPTLSKAAIEDRYAHMSDPDAVAIRRYGIFKQLSGRIFKEFDYRVHFIDKEKYFPDGIPHDWVHARGIDFHPQTPWACGMISISPTNEAFIWGEMNPSPEKFTVREIAREFALIGKDYKFRLNLVDPYAEAVKKDFVSVLDDLNRNFHELKKEGIGTGGYWQSWDTKGERGRDAIKERIKNSAALGKPFNNKINKNGATEYLPTIWVLSNCKISAESMKNWRWEEWANTNMAQSKDSKNTPEQKWSHFNMVWEAVFKHPAFKPPTQRIGDSRNYSYTYFRR